ncbi:RNA polymerase subunit sigma-70 [Adhaeribacter arboris]|uniref:RNA polymerase subunit sigma-70 n=1 Tax=Adhaeribacter arboris TaxID=2072846 RepID=A0A2T2YC39_9BACT|nr:sigma-70 family RNA polymerase sigma factor [Adhaeribacter arboris]PSR53064.1 RNA polymerase subunit sigma-70 [Adhaeribacter arboris]
MKITHQSDEVLIQGLQIGSRQALEFIYSTYWPMIANFVRLNNGSPEEAEDLYQEGVIILYEQVKKGNFSMNSSLKTYLYAICRNKWLSKLKKQVPITDVEEQLQQIPMEEPAMDTPYVEEAALKQAIESLGEPCRSVIVGFYYHKLSLEQLAADLNYSNANVAKQQKFRCVERLKKKFLHLSL